MGEWRGVGERELVREVGVEGEGEIFTFVDLASNPVTFKNCSRLMSWSSSLLTFSTGTAAYSSSSSSCLRH